MAKSTYKRKHLTSELTVSEGELMTVKAESGCRQAGWQTWRLSGSGELTSYPQAAVRETETERGENGPGMDF